MLTAEAVCGANAKRILQTLLVAKTTFAVSWNFQRQLRNLQLFSSAETKTTAIMSRTNFCFVSEHITLQKE
jgi:hypothetical protein